MKHRRALVFAAVAAALVLGFFAPKLMESLAGGAGDDGTLSVEPMALDYATSAPVQVLSRLTGSDDEVLATEIKTGRRYTPSTAAEHVAKQMQAFLMENGLSDAPDAFGEAARWEAAPMMVVRAEESGAWSTVVWYCGLENDGDDYALNSGGAFFDDASGALLGCWVTLPAEPFLDQDLGAISLGCVKSLANGMGDGFTVEKDGEVLDEAYDTEVYSDWYFLVYSYLLTDETGASAPIYVTWQDAGLEENAGESCLILQITWEI